MEQESCAEQQLYLAVAHGCEEEQVHLIRLSSVSGIDETFGGHSTGQSAFDPSSSLHPYLTASTSGGSGESAASHIIA